MGRKKVDIPATTISCQITPDERDALGTVAKQFGFTSVAEFTRFCILNTCSNELESAIDFLLPTADRPRSEKTAIVQG